MRRVNVLLVAILAGTCLLGGASRGLADEDDDFLAVLKLKLEMNGPVNEGRKDNRNGARTGSVVDWLTNPGDVHIEHEPAKKFKGQVIVHFSGRERKADFVLGGQRDTNDTQASGRVIATYSLTRDGEVLIKDVRKEGGRGRVGDSVVTHVTSLNGAALR